MGQDQDGRQHQSAAAAVKLAWLAVLLLLSCSYLEGPCTRKETVIVETNCEEGGRSTTTRPVRIPQ